MSTNISEDATYWVASRSSISVPKKLALNTIDFSRGVRSNELNENFDLIKYWIEAERLRIGGWGIVEGFELTGDTKQFTVAVGNGIIINEHGQEVHVPATDPPLMAGPPVYTTLLETHTIDENGLLTLNFAMYSNRNKCVIRYVPPTHMPEGIEDEFSIIVKDTGKKLDLNRDIQVIAENTVLIPGYPNTEVTVEYMYANDRIDGIFLYKDGTDYQYELGIISTSPSNQVVQDYFERGYYLIGFAYWHVGEEIYVEFFTGDRTYRKVFVDRNNVLYLNGKPYKEKTVIYFVEPDPPRENDLWYNIEDEILYIWRPNEKGVYEWRPVNDLARSVISAHLFTEGENPDDLQTFRFDAYPELTFVPKMHQLTVIIDQIVIMEDQYEELYPVDGEGLPSGFGIRFKYPLERASKVEIRVAHNINTNKKKLDLFPHESFYGNSGYVVITDPNQKIYDAKCQFQYLQSQIEVYRNGFRLIEGVQYVGVLLDGTEAQTIHTGELCDRFKLLIDLAVDDIISFRVLRPVASYSNLNSIVSKYQDIAGECVARTETVEDQLDTLSQNVSSMNEYYSTAIDTHAAQINALQTGKMTADKKIDSDNLAMTIRNGIIKGKFVSERQADDSIIYLSGLSKQDYFTIGYQPVNKDTILLFEGQDYELEAAEDGVNLCLSSRWTGDADAKLFINVLRIGV